MDILQPSTSPFIETRKQEFLTAFDNTIHTNKRFLLFSGTFFCLELLLFFLFLPFLLKHALISLMLGGIVFTLFGFYMVKQYLSFKKSAVLRRELDQLSEKIKKAAPHSPGTLPYHLELSKIACLLADTLRGRETHYYRLPKPLSFLTKSAKALSERAHRQDILLTREMLLQAAIEEHLSFVKAAPTTPDAHTLLAHVYVLLSELYGEFRKNDPTYAIKFRETLLKAIEEFNILKEFHPHDPWVHLQLAYSYRDLGETDKEKALYETLIELLPQDLDIKFRLGSLYFSKGENGKGLKIYEELRKASYPQAAQLIKHYGRG